MTRDRRHDKAKELSDFAHVSWDEIALITKLNSNGDVVYRITKGRGIKGAIVGSLYAGNRYFKYEGVLIPYRVLQEFHRRMKEL